jgi:hypothetical protein
MAEIIDFKGAWERKRTGKRMAIPEKKSTGPSNVAGRNISEEALSGSRLKLLDIIRVMINTTEEAGARKELMLSATRNFSSSTLETIRNEVRKYSNPQLARFFLESTENEWNAKPTFYKAIVEELEERVESDI